MIFHYKPLDFISPQDRPSVTPGPNFSASNDAAALRTAMRGLGTDEDALIEVLCKRPIAQRLEIVKVYKTNYGKDLIKDVKSETDGHFRDLLVALMTPTIEYFTEELHSGLSGIGTDLEPLLDIMPTLTNYQMREVSALYKQKYGKNLEEKLLSDLSGGIRRLMVSLSNGNRDESMMTNTLMARADANSLKSVVVGGGETEEIAVNQIMCQRNFDQIKLISQEYEKLTGHSLDDDIKDKFSGDLAKGLKSVLRYAVNRPAFFASRLHKAIAGIGTNQKSLNRIIVTRSEIDMENIKEEFQKMYGDTLRSFIRGDTSKDYKHALYTLINERQKK
jgi:annexin A7/11